jgi:hypothetical protein
MTTATQPAPAPALPDRGARPIETVKQRNRRLLIEALRAGLDFDLVAPGLYLVASSDHDGAFYRVQVDDAHGPLKAIRFRCSCLWSRKITAGWAAGDARPARPCKHMLLLYFFHAPTTLQQSLCADDELADALDAWSRATAAAAPLARKTDD